jgi:5-methylcytosine-specific restriction protein A
MPLQYCDQPGCSGLAKTGKFCAVHKDSNYLKDRRAMRPELDRWYHLASWARVRAYKLRGEPICELCLEEYGRGEIDRPEPATEVHHKNSSWKERGSWRDFIDQANLQSLCRRHHSKITLEENRKRGVM